MKYINYLSNSIIPVIIILIVFTAMREKIKIFDVFLEGAKEGFEIVLGIFPTLIGLFVAIGVLRSSGFIDKIIEILSPVITGIGFPKEIMPLAILRPISRKCINCCRNRYYEAIWG